MNIIFNLQNNMLNCIFQFTGDWGISIVLLTVIIRVLLMPISIKQKISLSKQQVISEKIEKLKEKYKNNKEKLDSELQKYYAQSAKGMLGCLVSLLQLPVISVLYFVIMKMPVQAGTMIIPWVSSIKMPDRYFIIPMIYTLICLCPSLLPYVSFFKISGQAKMTKTNLIFAGIFSIFITFRTPIAIGIYFITSGLFSLLEEIGYRIYIKSRHFKLSGQM